ncbi:MAG: universal stress protein [Cyanobacteria bacterium TGS_CYA1]|nr:universal stress protein [Cyanobacteria bacterium TGS_CYA1]
MKVIVAVDDSPFSKEVIHSLLSRPWSDKTEFKILNVIEPMCMAPTDNEDKEFQESLEKMNALRKEAAEKFCEHAVKQVSKHFPDHKVLCEIRQGAAKSEIVNAAIDWKADKILIGAHGRDICPHNLIGSVSRAVVHSAPCSVEVVRTHEHAT